MCQTEKNVQCLRLTRRKNGFVFDVIWIYNYLYSLTRTEKI